MLVFIIGLFYRRSRRKSLAAMRRQYRLRAWKARCGPEPAPLVGRYRFRRLEWAARRCRLRFLFEQRRKSEESAMSLVIAIIVLAAVYLLMRRKRSWDDPRCERGTEAPAV